MGNASDCFFPDQDDSPGTCRTSPLHTLAETVQTAAVPAHDELQGVKHYVRILNSGDHALLMRIHLIRLARKSIHIQTYILRNDHTSRYILRELIAAARRGVQVKIIADVIDSARDPNFVAFIEDAHPNMHIRIYNPCTDHLCSSVMEKLSQVAFRFRKFNQRMHNKLFIVDDQFGISGGRNMENDYFDRDRYRNFKDRDILIIGPVVHRMTRSFFKFWNFELTVSATDFEDVARALESQSYRKHMDLDREQEYGDLFKDIDEREKDDGYMQRTFVESVREIKRIMFVADEPYKNKARGLKGGGRVATVLTRLLMDARHTVILQTPYLVLDRVAKKAFQIARKRNPRLNIIVSINSLAATDSIHVYSYTHREKWRYMKKFRFRMFEMKPIPGDRDLMMPNEAGRRPEEFPKKDSGFLRSLMEGMSEPSPERSLRIHAKSYVLDDEISYIGSFNLDPRSFHINTENGIVIWDQGVAQSLKDNIMRDVAPQNSWTVGRKRNKFLWARYTFYLVRFFKWSSLFHHERMQYASLFELKPGKKVVPWYHKDFYRNYQDIGPFPQVHLSPRHIQLQLIQSFVGFTEPII